MEFDYMEYYKVLLIASTCIMLFSIIAILISTVVYRKSIFPIKFDARLLRYFISVAVLVFFFTVGVLPFRHGVYLIYEKESEKIECAGEITEFKKVYGNNKYVYNGKSTFAYYVFIDNEKYYIMHTSDLKVGDAVEFEYLPKSRVILSIEKA